MISPNLQGIPYQEQTHPKRGDKDSKKRSATHTGI